MKLLLFTLLLSGCAYGSGDVPLDLADDAGNTYPPFCTGICSATPWVFPPDAGIPSNGGWSGNSGAIPDHNVQYR